VFSVTSKRGNMTCMGLAKKQSRKIVVDGQEFRWTVSRTRQAAKGEVDVIVESAQHKGRLVVAVPCRNAWLDFPDLVESRGQSDMTELERVTSREAYRPVTPRVVERIIREASAANWNRENGRG